MNLASVPSALFEIYLLDAPPCLRTFIYHVSMPAYKRAVYGTEVSKGKYTSFVISLSYLASTLRSELPVILSGKKKTRELVNHDLFFSGAPRWKEENFLQTKSKTLITSRSRHVVCVARLRMGVNEVNDLTSQVKQSRQLDLFLFSLSLAIKNFLLLFKLHNQAKPRGLIKVDLISARRATEISCRIKLQCEIFIKSIKFFMTQIALKSLAYLSSAINPDAARGKCARQSDDSEVKFSGF